MSELARERCQACSGQTPPLPEAESASLLSQLSSGWQLQGTILRRSFRLADFAAVFTLATRIALIAEREGHHPELHLGWGHCEVELTTHAISGLSRNDFIMAAKIDRALAAGLAGEVSP